MFSAARYNGDTLVAEVGKQGDDFVKTFDHVNCLFCDLHRKTLRLSRGQFNPPRKIKMPRQNSR
jgi:hypothetical protein